jgi:hypothetical protein
MTTTLKIDPEQIAYRSPLENFTRDCYQRLNTNPDVPVSFDVRSRVELAKLMYHLKTQENRSLFLLSLTYKARKDFPLIPRLINRNFIRFYCSYFLPNILETKHYHKNRKRLQQPITLAFLDDHSVKRANFIDDPQRNLHHHAIVAATESTLPLINLMTGTNTFVDKSNQFFIRTSDLKPCDAFTTLYAAKCFKKYPDFLSFPDRFHAALQDMNAPVKSDD